MRKIKDKSSIREKIEKILNPTYMDRGIEIPVSEPDEEKQINDILSLITNKSPKECRHGVPLEYQEKCVYCIEELEKKLPRKSPKPSKNKPVKVELGEIEKIKGIYYGGAYQMTTEAAKINEIIDVLNKLVKSIKGGEKQYG